MASASLAWSHGPAPKEGLHGCPGSGRPRYLGPPAPDWLRRLDVGGIFVRLLLSVAALLAFLLAAPAVAVAQDASPVASPAAGCIHPE